MDNCVYTTKKLLDLLNVKRTKKYLRDSILSHPDYPSLLSISDTLNNKYHIESLAIKTDFSKLRDLPMPCIVQLKINGNPGFFVIKNVLEHKVIYYNEKNKLISSTEEDFTKLWTGVCLLVETSEKSKEVGIEKRIIEYKFINTLKASIIVLLLSWLIISLLRFDALGDNSFTLYAGIYTIIKVIGLAVGISLLWYDIDKYNPKLQNFCSAGGSGGRSGKINCNSVLTSKHASFFNGSLSLSLLSFSYFFGSLAFVLINSFSLTSLSILNFFSFLTFPIVLISIYYQAVIIKQWCKFCIIIQAVLLIEILISFFSEFYKTPILFETLPLLFALFLIPILCWNLIKPLLVKQKEIYVHKRGLKKIKNNPNVFHGLLSKTRKIENTTEGLGISFNNPGAKYNIIKVCSPYCDHCSKAHPILDSLVNAGKINLQILYTARPDSKDAGAKPVSHFLATDAQGDRKKTQQVLDAWYNSKDNNYDLFANKHPINGEFEDQFSKIEAMHTWCDLENIKVTPTIFINNNQLPEEYSIEDLSDVIH